MKKPPKIFDRLLRWYCVHTDLEDIQGDFYEVYYDRMEDSPIKANWLFALDTLKLLNPFSKQKKRSTWLGESYQFNFRNQINIALRHLRKNPFINALKILGLSIAIAAFLFTTDYVRFHNNFDQFHEKKDRIYRIVTTVTSPDLQDVTAWSHAYIRDIADELTGIEHVVRLLKFEEAAIINTGKKQFKESEIYYADPELSQVFSYQWLEGNPATALMDPSSVIITESAAKKYFNSAYGLIGEILNIDEAPYKVTGVVEDVPENSDFKFDLLVPLTYSALEDWMFVYVLLESGSNIDEVASTLAQIIPEYNDHYTDQGISLVYDFENITEIHYSEPKLYDLPKMDKQRIQLFTLVAWIILITAFVNYINLYTTLLLQRVRNINVQMVIGASKKQLFLEFVTETLIYVGLSLLIGLGITLISADLLSQFADFPFFTAPIPTISYALLLLCFLGSVLILSLYSLVITTRKSSNQLFEAKTIKAPLRKFLIGLQFALSFLVISGTFIIYLQTAHIQNQPLGFNPDQTIRFQFPDYIDQSKVEAIKRDLSALSFVESLAQIESKAVPGMDAWVEEYYVPELDQTKLFQELGVDEHYDETLKLRIVSGEFFTSQKHRPHRAFVVNEAFLNHLGWSSEEVIGKKLNVYGHSAPIIGVTKNFYFNSPHELIQPLIINYAPRGSFALARLSENIDLAAAIERLELTWFNHLPDLPFNFSFVKSDYDIQFKEEQSTINVLGLVASLVIVLSLLGMYAILKMLSKAREKELGIRKVNGAQPIDLFKLYAREFILILLASLLISIPIAWTTLQKWLAQYPIRISLNPTYFLLIALLVVISASLVIFFQANKAYQVNTVESLKHE